MSMGERRPGPREHGARLRGGFSSPYRYHEEVVCCNILGYRRRYPSSPTSELAYASTAGEFAGKITALKEVQHFLLQFQMY